MLSKSDWFGVALTAISVGIGFLVGGTIAGVVCLVIGVIALVVWHYKQDDLLPLKPSSQTPEASGGGTGVTFTGGEWERAHAQQLLDDEISRAEARIEDDGQRVYLVVTSGRVAEYWVRLSNQQ